MIKPVTQTVYVRIDAKVAKKIRKQAETEGRTLNSLIAYALKLFSEGKITRA